jgi:hypothetical protein
MESLIEASAEELGKKITEEGIPDIACIGIADQKKQIIVYLKKRTSDHAKIPREWDGFEVILKVSGAIKPL